jgi:antitoxin CcdA
LRHTIWEKTMLAASRPRAGSKRATNISLPEDLLAEAKALQINISQAAEAGVAQAITRARSELWLAENQEAIESSNAYVGKHGLPLAKYRMF